MLEDGARQLPEGGEGHGHFHGGLGVLQAHQLLHHRLAQRVQDSCTSTVTSTVL